jgi:pentatricopeptide repeat protein
METSMQGRLYSLAKRLKIGRILRYGDLWARYLWRRTMSAVTASRGRPETIGAAALGADLAMAGMGGAKRMTVASWLPLDRANVGLQRAMLASLVEARPDLGVTPQILDCLSRLKRADDASACVDAMVAQGISPRTVNTALYVLLLRRLPAPSELAMIAARHPRHALITILSGDEHRKQGRRGPPG